MARVLDDVADFAPNRYTVLITGETGVGKGLIARAIHRVSRQTGPSLSVNVAGLDDHLFSDALFGHLRGAFSGADRERAGMIRQAEGGTLFLDEIGDLSLQSQIKLLRLLEDSEYFPLGSDAPRKANCRFIVATNRDLKKFMREGHFRRDLYYRVNSQHIHVPPLRERSEDVPALTEHFVSEIAAEMGKSTPKVRPECMEALMAYRFPGNVRQLRGLVLEALSRHSADSPWLAIAVPSAPSDVISSSESTFSAGEEPQDFRHGPTFGIQDPLPTLKEMTWALIVEALRRAGGNQTAAARTLGLSQQALSQRLQRGSPATQRKSAAQDLKSVARSMLNANGHNGPIHESDCVASK